MNITDNYRLVDGLMVLTPFCRLCSEVGCWESGWRFGIVGGGPGYQNDCPCPKDGTIHFWIIFGSAVVKWWGRSFWYLRYVLFPSSPSDLWVWWRIEFCLWGWVQVFPRWGMVHQVSQIQRSWLLYFVLEFYWGEDFCKVHIQILTNCK